MNPTSKGVLLVIWITSMLPPGVRSQETDAGPASGTVTMDCSLSTSTIQHGRDAVGPETIRRLVREAVKLSAKPDNPTAVLKRK